MSDNSFYLDLAQRIENSFAEIENDIIINFRKTDPKYYTLYQKMSKLKSNHPFISEVMGSSGNISLTTKEHKVLTDYFKLQFQLDNMEHQQLYFRGHTDCISYLKKIDVL